MRFVSVQIIYLSHGAIKQESCANSTLLIIPKGFKNWHIYEILLISFKTDPDQSLEFTLEKDT